ncbi:outer membrane lipoprotein LolB [Spongiibacter nanhainus]|uniref:Outer-membrane lipoprotein LolB n=1 Tax=Spongiibacter nanhainus TaxID=2794344 RepID=A0A7T4QZG0_9GAMM|nr:lipoprotein insertase outer membrane protein LolB [Spongiibacter nanhainus]QQD17650.1 outer membrane lipoprotein LolB [Spongiibacter nanhainus]
MTRSTLAAILAALLVSACATIPPSTGKDYWRMQGKIGVWYKDQRESGTLDWNQCGSRYFAIALRGPAGIGGIDIRYGPDGATLEQGGEEQRAPDAETLAARSGWPIPVDSLRYWLRGRANPGFPQQSQLSPEGKLELLQQSGWRIQYSDYAENSGLPTRLEARRDSKRIKIIVWEWSSEANCHHD